MVLTLNSFPYGGLPFPEICRLSFRACVKWDLYVALPRFEFRFRLYLTRNTWSAAVPLLSSGFRLDLPTLFRILFNRSVKDLCVDVPLAERFPRLLCHPRALLEAIAVFPLQRYVSTMKNIVASRGR